VVDGDLQVEGLLGIRPRRSAERNRLGQSHVSPFPQVDFPWGAPVGHCRAIWHQMPPDDRLGLPGTSR
jgi:hypothetical protein